MRTFVVLTKYFSKKTNSYEGYFLKVFSKAKLSWSFLATLLPPQPSKIYVNVHVHYVD